MEVPADMKVNGEPHFHVTAKQGTADLHIRLLEFYAKHALVDKVILNAAAVKLDASELTVKLTDPPIDKLDKVLVIDAHEQVTDIDLREID